MVLNDSGVVLNGLGVVLNGLGVVLNGSGVVLNGGWQVADRNDLLGDSSMAVLIHFLSTEDAEGYGMARLPDAILRCARAEFPWISALSVDGNAAVFVVFTP